MNKKIIICSLFFILLSLCSKSFAQRTANIKSEYTCEVPGNVSTDDFKREVLRAAQTKALAEEFGTFISQTNTSTVSNANDQSDVRINSYRVSDVRGEWLSDIEKPRYRFFYDDKGTHMVEVRVHFRAREIEQSKIDCDITLLRNQMRFRKGANYTFNHDDRVEIAFRSPVKGYLAVYLDDGQGNLFCMLPYPGQEGYAFPVSKDVEYLLFDRASASDDEQAYVEQYQLKAPNGMEHNRIFVLFSPKKFVKATDNPDENKEVPPQLKEKDFHEWLGRCRKADKEMQTFEFPITIYPQES